MEQGRDQELFVCLFWNTIKMQEFEKCYSLHVGEIQCCLAKESVFNKGNLSFVLFCLSVCNKKIYIYRLLHRLKPWKSHLFSIIPSFLICKMKINFRATQLPSCFWVPWNLNSFQYFLFLNKKKKKLISNCDPKVYSKLLVRRKKLPLVTFRHPSEHVISYNMDIVFEFNTLWVVFFALIQI